MSTRLRELDLPQTVYEADDDVATEFVRFWVSGGQDHVALRVGSFPAEEEAENWGMIVADIARHAVRGMQQDDPSRGSAEQMLAQIEAAFLERLRQSHEDLTGQINSDKQ